MESEEGNNSQPSINLGESNAAMEITSEDNTIGDDLEEENISENSVKRKHTSEAWNHFKRLMIDKTQYAECNYCNTKLKAPPSHGTTHLKKHYERACKKRPRKMDIRQSLIMANKKTSGQELTTHIFNQDDSRNKLAKMVILHDYPLSMVDHIGFRSYSSSLQPCFKMVSRNTLKNDIINIYKDEKAKSYKFIDKLKCRIAITTDMWTANNTKKGFMAVTGHFIDDSWILQSCILRFIYVPAPHTAEVLSDILVESFMDWNIDRKVSTITVDNCTTNDAMIHLLLEKLSRKDFPLDGKVLHMRCCAHILNLIVKDGLEIISEAIERIRDSVLYWTASPSRVEKFEEATRQLHINCTKKLALDCKTRWNSTYLMLETAILYKDVFPRVKCRERNYKNVPTDEDWENAIEICGKLKVFYQVTEMFSGTLYPTSNFYFPKICDIKLKLDEWVKSPKIMIQCMAQKMLVKYEKYWEVCHIMMGVAAVLDPRYKMKLVEFYLSRIYGQRSQIKIDEIRQNCYDLLIDYQSRASTLKENNSAATSFGTLGTPSCGSNLVDSSESDVLEMYDQFVASSTNPTTSVSLTSELDMYLEENVLPRAPNFDILSWWKTNGVRYPILQKIARDILAIPVSTVASESAFSCSGRLISPHRNRLHPDVLEALMCSRRWLLNEVKGTCSSIDGISTCPTMLDEEEDDYQEGFEERN